MSQAENNNPGEAASSDQPVVPARLSAALRTEFGGAASAVPARVDAAILAHAASAGSAPLAEPGAAKSDSGADKAGADKAGAGVPRPMTGSHAGLRLAGGRAVGRPAGARRVRAGVRVWGPLAAAAVVIVGTGVLFLNPQLAGPIGMLGQAQPKVAPSGPTTAARAAAAEAMTGVARDEASPGAAADRFYAGLAGADPAADAARTDAEAPELALADVPSGTSLVEALPRLVVPAPVAEPAAAPSVAPASSRLAQREVAAAVGRDRRGLEESLVGPPNRIDADDINGDGWVDVLDAHVLALRAGVAGEGALLGVQPLAAARGEAGDSPSAVLRVMRRIVKVEDGQP